MKSLKDFIIEESRQTQIEILRDEVSQILKPFGNKKEGFKKDFDQDEVDDLMSREGWEFSKEEEDNKDHVMTYIWTKQDYECHIFVDPMKKRILNFNIFS